MYVNMNMYISIYVYIYVHICTYMYIYVNICRDMEMYVNICKYGNIWKYVNICKYMCIFFARVLRAQGGYIAKFATQRAAGSATAETERNLNKQNHAFLQIGQQF